MRKLLKLLPFLFLILPSFAFADYSLNSTASTNYNGSALHNDGRINYAEQFTTIGAGTVSSVSTCLMKEGSATSNVLVGIYTDSAGAPNTQVGSDSGTVSIPSITSYPTGTVTAFSFSSPVSLSASTNYWLVVKADNLSDLSGGNFVEGCGTNGDSGSIPYFSENNFGVWAPFTLDNVNITINVVEGGGGGGGTTTPSGVFNASTTYSIIDNPNQDYFTGVALFFVLCGGVLFVFKKKND